MVRPGSAQVGLAKQFFARYPWHRLEPKPDTAAWGDNQSTKEDIRPCALGTGTDLRIVYVPRPRPIVVKQLVPQTDYMAGLFDPVTGAYSSLGTIKTNGDGTWPCLPPEHRHDWVLVLQRPTIPASAGTHTSQPGQPIEVRSHRSERIRAASKWRIPVKRVQP